MQCNMCKLQPIGKRGKHALVHHTRSLNNKEAVDNLIQHSLAGWQHLAQCELHLTQLGQGMLSSKMMCRMIDVVYLQ